ncbi:Diacylglycerol O-acyltransferase 2 [Chamberlinius hualienensis]
MGEYYKVPFERVLQAVCLAIFLSFLVSIHVSGNIVYVLVFTPYYPLSLLYIAWLITDYRTCNTGGRRIEWVRKNSWLKTLAGDYFPFRLHKTADLDPNRNYLCGSHPHGYLCFSAFVNIAQEITGFSQTFPGITPHLLSFHLMFFLPFFRDYLLAVGNCSTTKESIEYILTKKGKGNMVVDVVGGAAEIPYTRPNHMILILKERKGFVKLAIRCGADLLPMLHFGEGEIFDQAWLPKISFIDRFSAFFKRTIGYDPAVYVSLNYVLSVILHGLPKRKELYTVVGRPIQVEKDPNPSQELIDEYHRKYIEGVQQLFEESKLKLGPEYENVELSII